MELFPYQSIGVDFLASRVGAYLADDMRLGKTPQAIRGADKIAARRILVTTTTNGRPNWAREFADWQTLDRPIFEVESTRGRIPDEGVVIASYEQVLRDSVYNQLLLSEWDLIIPDEAHRLKNPAAETTRRVLGRDKLAARAAVRWPLSGTPSPNHPGELWTTLYVTSPRCLYDDGKLMGYDAFRKRYCNIVVDRKTGRERVLGGKNADELKQRLADVMLRRTKEEVWPERPRVVWAPPLLIQPGDVAAEIRALEESREGLQLKALLAAGDLPPANDATLATLRRLTGRVKAVAVAELVADDLMWGAKDKIALFGWHREVLEELARRLAAFGVAVVHGGTPDAKEQIARFQNDPRVRVFVGQIKSIAENVRLDAADDALVVEPSWTPGDNFQVAERIWHLTKHRAMTARFVALARSIDDAVLRVFTRKCRSLAGVYQ